MEEDINNYKLGNTIQEFEELFGNVPINDIYKIKKYLFENFIPTSVIQKKIEEVNNSNGYSPVNKIFIEKVLNEILEEGRR